MNQSNPDPLTPAASAGALRGIRILDLTSIVMGPFATQIMGDMGADVIKVEPPGGDALRYTSHSRHPGMGNLFMNCNRNKRSVALDLKSGAGRDAFLKLAATCDVLLYNVRPQAMARLKLSYEDLRAVNPKLVYVGGFGFGEAGPYAGRAAFDDLIQAMVAVPDMVHRAGADVPRFVPINFCDRVTGLSLVNTVLGALLYRERFGAGQAVEVPMFETMAQFVLGEHLGGHSFVPPLAPPGYARILNAWRKPHATRDGYLCILVYNDKQWRAFFEAIGKPEMHKDPLFATMASRSASIERIYAWLGGEIAGRTTAEWLALLERVDIPYTPVRSIEELLDDPHLRAVGFFRTYEHPSEGTMLEAGLPSTWSATPLSIRRPPPRLGEHTREVLGEVGLAIAEIEALVAAGAKGAPA